MTIALDFLRRYWLTIALVLGCVAVLFVVSGAIGRWVAESRAVEAAHAKAGAATAQAGENASGAAAEAVAGLGEREAVRTETTQENRDAILSAPDAKADAGAAGGAGLAGLCKRPAYRDSERCARLRGSHPAPGSR